MDDTTLSVKEIAEIERYPKLMFQRQFKALIEMARRSLVMRELIEKISNLAHEGMATGESRDALNDVKWAVRDFQAALAQEPDHAE